MTARMIDDPHGTDRPQRWPLPEQHPYAPVFSATSPADCCGAKWQGDYCPCSLNLHGLAPCGLRLCRECLALGWPGWQVAAAVRAGVVLPAPAQAPLPVRHPKHAVPLDARARPGAKPQRPEMLAAPVAEDVTSVPALGEVVSSGDRRGLSVAREALAGPEVTHQCPPEGEFVAPCCGMTPFDLPRTDRMTLDSSLVNCPSPPTSGTVTHQQPGPGSTVLPCCGMSLFDLSDGSKTTSDPGLVNCPRAQCPMPIDTSSGPERPVASAVVTEQGGGEGPAGQPGPSCPAGLAAASPEPAEVPVKPSVAAEARAAVIEP